LSQKPQVAERKMNISRRKEGGETIQELKTISSFGCS